MSERVITLQPADATCREAVLAYAEAVRRATGLTFSVDPQGESDDVELEGGQELAEVLAIRWQLPDPPADQLEQDDEWQQSRSGAADASAGLAERRLGRFEPTMHALARSAEAAASLLDRMEKSGRRNPKPAGSLDDRP